MCAVAGLAVWPAAAAAAPAQNPHGRIVGVVPAHGHPLTASPAPAPSSNLTYHLGPVMHSNSTHVVYWEPTGFTVTANYHSLIQRYFGDVAADSGRVTNVYATDTQYNDSTNTFIQYQQTFAGALTDTTAFPATVAGCPLTDGTRTVSNCLTQTQEAAELDNFIQANSLPRGLNNLYFLVLPKGVETCADDFKSCGNILNTTPNRYCAIL